jgi:HlyD family secretion protein
MALREMENVKERPNRVVPVDAPDSANGGRSGGNRPSGAGVPPRRASKKWLPWVAVAVILVLGLAWRARTARQSAGPGAGAAAGGRGGRGADLPVVRTVAVTTGNLAQVLAVTGSLKTNQNVDLNSKISGRVARVLVREGDRIRIGQLLVQLDDEDLRAQVAAAQASLNSAEVRLRQTILGLPAREQQVFTSIQQAEADLQTAQARYQQARLNEPARIQSARSDVQTATQGVRTAQARLQQARETAQQTELTTASEVQRAEAGVEQARAALAEVQRGAREQQIAQAQAAVNIAQANADNAQTELRRQQTLFEGGAVARAAVETAQTTYNVQRAQLESAQQNLSLVREGATTEQVRQAQEAVQQAEATLGQARGNRLTQVPISQGEVTTARAALAQAQAALRTARSNLAQAPIARQETRVAQEAVGQSRAALAQARANRSNIPVARQDVASARAGVQQARAALQQAQVNLGYARIYSPVNGVVNTKLTDPGETAAPGTTLLNLVSLDRVYFEALVSENNITRIRVGQPAQIIASAVSERALPAVISDIIPTADPRSRQFRLRITIPNAPRELTPGAFARGTITTQQVNNTLLVPSDAILQANNQQVVWLAVGPPDSAQAERRLVSTGISANGRTQIIGGVQPGERVIIGEETLEVGEKVRVAKT